MNITFQLFVLVFQTAVILWLLYMLDRARGTIKEMTKLVNEQKYFIGKLKQAQESKS